MKYPGQGQMGGAKLNRRLQLEITLKPKDMSRHGLRGSCVATSNALDLSESLGPCCNNRTSSPRTDFRDKAAAQGRASSLSYPPKEGKLPVRLPKPQP